MKYVECVDEKRTFGAYYYEKLRSGARVGLKKNKIKPNEVTLYSNKKRWWICPKCDKSWFASPAKRANGQECSCNLKR